MPDRLRELLSAFDPKLPLERARTIPASWYFDPEIAAAERRGVFGKNWIIVGRTDQLEAPGSFLTAEVAGEPLLLVRGDDGKLRAFFNVCRHRAAPLLIEPSGHVTKLRCRYHGWTYDLAGRLRGTPEFDGVQEFRREDNGLAEIAVETWGPLVAVCMDQPPSPFADFLAPLPERTAVGLAGLQFAERRDYVLNCNWKVYVDNYLDGGYHINTVHPSLAGMLDYSQYRTETFAWSSVQSGPLTTAGGAVRSGQAQYWYVFPNFMLNLYAGVADTNLVLPLGPDRCRVMFDFYFASDDPKFRAESLAVADAVQREDVGICEDVQRGLGSRSFDAGRFSVKRENAGYHFHQLLAQSLRAAAGV
ncbi:MAG: aromatic ring-hydroxylating oxygenase subunit alpha [Gemmataceae bacterium]